MTIQYAFSSSRRDLSFETHFVFSRKQCSKKCFVPRISWIEIRAQRYFRGQKFASKDIFVLQCACSSVTLTSSFASSSSVRGCFFLSSPDAFPGGFLLPPVRGCFSSVTLLPYFGSSSSFGFRGRYRRVALVLCNVM